MILDSLTVPEEIANLLTRATVSFTYRDITAVLKDLQHTLDYPCPDFPVWVLSVRDLKLLMTNDEVGKTRDWVPSAWKILNKALGIFRAYSFIFGEHGLFTETVSVRNECVTFAINK